jgi:predicted nucleotidyltransferase
MPNAALQALNLPANVNAALDRLCAELGRAAGNNLAGVVLYGGLARGRYRPGQSDINVVVLLREASCAALTAINPPLKAAWRAIRVEPFLMTPAEVPSAASVFSSKFLDIKSHHVLLTGEDPFAGLAISREDLRRDLRESLRNIRFRMRQRYFRLGEDAAELALALTAFARPLALETACLLHCAGEGLPDEDRSRAIFEAAAAAFGLDDDALQRLAALRQTPQVPPDAADLFGRVLAVLDRLIQVADEMKSV